MLVSRAVLNIFNLDAHSVSMVFGCFSVIIISISVLSTLALMFFSDKNIIYFFGFIILTSVLFVTFKIAFVFDYSWDGLAYHLPSILSIREGWNPFRDPHARLLLTNTYPNGFWTLSAIYGAILGSYEYGKIINGFLSLCFAIISIHTIDCIKKNKILSFLVISCVLLSNIASQFFTNHLDGSIYILFSLFLMIVFIHAYSEYDRRYAAASVSIIIVLINTKTSGLYFAVTGLTIWFLIQYRILTGSNTLKIKKSGVFLLFLGVVCFVLGVIIVGWRPWVTNIVEYKSVFYPDPQTTLMGMAPSNLREYNPFQSIIHAIYGYHTDAPPPETAHLKPPFIVEAAEFSISPIGPRSGGFGPLFGAMVTIAFAARLLSRFLHRLKFGNIDYVCMIIFSASAVLPGAWWARFIPMVYLIPLLLTLKVLKSDGIFSRITGLLIIMLSIINFIPTIIFYQNLQAYAGYADNILKTLYYDKSKVVIVHDDPFGDQNTASHHVWSKRLAANGIPYRVTQNSADCGDVVLTSVFVRLCRERD